MRTSDGIHAASDAPKGTDVENDFEALGGSIGRGGRVRRRESTGLPKSLLGLLAVLVAGSATAAVFSKRPPTFADLGAPAERASQIANPPGAAIAIVSDSKPAPEIESVETLSAKVRTLRAANRPTELANILIVLAERHIVEGAPALAVPLLDEAVRTVKGKAIDVSLYGRALHDQGWAFLLNQEGKRAAEPLTKARAIRERTHAPATDLATTLSLLVWAEREAGNAAHAVQVAKDLVVLARRHPSEVDLPASLNVLGVTAVVAGDPGGAVGPLRESAKLLGPKDGKPLAATLHSLGWALLTSNESKLAAEPLSRAVAIRRKLEPNSTNLANSLQLFASACSENKAYPAATAADRELVDLARRGVKGIDLAAALEGLAVTLVMSNDPNGAVGPLKEAVKMHEGAPSKELAMSLHLLGWAYVRAGSPEARGPLERAAAMNEQLGLTDAARQSRVLLALVTT